MYVGLARAVLLKPALLPALARRAWTFRARDWYGRPPFLPVPPRSYMRWRMETAYGDSTTVPPVDGLGRYLRWASEMREERTL